MVHLQKKLAIWQCALLDFQLIDVFWKTNRPIAYELPVVFELEPDAQRYMYIPAIC